MFDEKIKTIDYLTLKLTDKCNMNCYMCGQRSANNIKRTQLDLSLIKERMDETMTIKTVYLFGGEPLLYEELPELLHYLKEKGVDVLITTNGILLKELTPSLLSSSVRDLTISIDSCDSNKYHKIRGVNCFGQVQNNMRYFINEREKFHMQKPYLGINCVILPENITELYKFYHYMSGQFPEVDRINFEAPIVIDAKLGHEYECIMSDNLYTKAPSWKGFQNSKIRFNSKEIDILKRSIDILKKCEKVTFLSPTENKEIDNIFIDKKKLVAQQCRLPDHALTILPNGDVVFCTDFPDYVLGNLYECGFGELINGDRAKAFRKEIQKSGLPICVTCPRYHDKGDFLIDIGREGC